MNKVISRIKGGLGNQLFCYAAARRLALVNNTELVIDNVTGFVRDKQFRRQYMLDHFQIPVRKATAAERLEPFERYRRGVLKWLSRSKPFAERRYLEQEGLDFDERLLFLRVNGTVYIDGYWQGEGYFKDVEQVIREDLQFIPPGDLQNVNMAREIMGSPAAVAVHVRWFDSPNMKSGSNISVDYYKRAMLLMEEKVALPMYYLFSDDPQLARAKLVLPEDRVCCVYHNRGEGGAFADMWLMSLCRHFITANSTFSWWGAWLGGGKEKVIVTPAVKIQTKPSWGFKGLIPDEWIKV